MPNTSSIPALLVIPFGLTLLSIAVLRLWIPHFWEKNLNKALVAALWALPVVAYFLTHQQGHYLTESAHEYFSFISLLTALFIISGGISLKGDLLAKPSINTIFLGLGAVLANLMGTTGASMLLIRPFLQTNSERKRTFHQPIFFILVVSNAGGLLTPLGDPPLFLGYLRGVPFSWTFKLFPIWLFTVGSLLLIFYLWDSRAYAKESPQSLREDRAHLEKLRLGGWFNFLILAGAVTGVLFPSPWREAILLGMAGLSFALTPRQIHQDNDFNFQPIIEVAILFAGIFITMVPALVLLKEHGKDFGMTTAAQFFWLTGALSSFLDNAPTYLTFFSLAQGLNGAGTLVAGVQEPLLKAISCGAVLMGANSYIGNGPNFMVKAIADRANFKTPHFFGYIFYAVVILGPLYLALTFLFFR
jgi:Na+/H+ antiporter NhaD/arsenite permease-like protein